MDDKPQPSIDSDLKHDLNNMLNLIIGNLELLRAQRDYDKAEQDLIIEDAYSAARDAEQMIKNSKSKKMDGDE